MSVRCFSSRKRTVCASSGTLCGCTATICPCSASKLTRCVRPVTDRSGGTLLFVWNIWRNPFFQCYEEARKTLETCDITTDNNCFVDMRQTGSVPPGKPRPLPDLHWLHPMVEILLLSWKCGGLGPHVMLFYPGLLNCFLTAPVSYENYYERDYTDQGNGTAGFVGEVMKRSELHKGSLWGIAVRYWLLAPFVDFQICSRVLPPVFPKSAALNQVDNLPSKVLCEQYTQ